MCVRERESVFGEEKVCVYEREEGGRARVRREAKNKEFMWCTCTGVCMCLCGEIERVYVIESGMLAGRDRVRNSRLLTYLIYYVNVIHGQRDR